MFNLKNAAMIIILSGIGLEFYSAGPRIYLGITVMLLGLAIAIYADMKSSKKCL
jgi:hypothetical protein